MQSVKQQGPPPKKRSLADACNTQERKKAAAAAAAEQSQLREKAPPPKKKNGAQLRMLSHTIDPTCKEGGGVDDETLIENPLLAVLIVEPDDNDLSDPTKKRKALRADCDRRSPGFGRFGYWPSAALHTRTLKHTL